MINAVVVEFPSVDLVVMVSINLLEEVFEVLLNHFPVEKFSALEFISHPSLEFTPFEHIVAVEIVSQEDVFYKCSAVSVHQNILDIILALWL